MTKGNDVPTITVQILTTIRDEMRGLRGDVGELRGEVHELRGAVHEIRGEVHELRGEVHELRGEVHELRGDVHDLRTEMRTLEASTARGFEAVTQRLEHLRDFSGERWRDHDRRIRRLETGRMPK